MLSIKHHLRAQPNRRSQGGVVLILALIALVALTLAAVALTRSVSTSNLVAGNLAFQQAATHSADRGIETAVTWLETNSVVTDADKCTTGTVLTCSRSADGYQALRTDPAANQTWDEFFQTNLDANKVKKMPEDDDATKATDNKVAYLIQRMCSTEGEANTDLNSCANSPLAASGSCPGGTTCTGGGGRGGTGSNVNVGKQTYYRITVRVSGPRNTQSLVQATVAL